MLRVVQKAFTFVIAKSGLAESSRRRTCEIIEK